MGTGPRFNEQGSEFQHVQWDPKGGELYLDTVRPWETAVEAGHRPDVQIELSDLGIGAKDSSNLLVAGFLRSFPQDSRSWLNEEDVLACSPLRWNANEPAVGRIVFSRSGCFSASTYVPGLCAVKQCTRGTGELTLLNLFSNCEGARLGCPHRFVVSLRSVLSLRQWVWIPIRRGV